MFVRLRLAKLPAWTKPSLYTPTTTRLTTSNSLCGASRCENQLASLSFATSAIGLCARASGDRGECSDTHVRPDGFVGEAFAELGKFIWIAWQVNHQRHQLIAALSRL